MKYTLLTVKATVDNYLTRDAAEFINSRAAAAGWSSAFSESELNSYRYELEREISECDEYIRERLMIEETEEELEE